MCAIGCTPQTIICKRGAAWKLSAGELFRCSRVWCNKEGWNSRARALKAKCAAPRTSLGNVFCPVQVVDFGYEKSRFSLRRPVCRRPDQTGFKTAGHHLNASAFFQQTPDSRRCYHKKTPHCAQFYFSMDQKILMRETGIPGRHIPSQRS